MEDRIPGQEIGRIEIRVPDYPPVHVPLAATHSVGSGGFLTRVEAVAKLLLQEIHPRLVF